MFHLCLGQLRSTFFEGASLPRKMYVQMHGFSKYTTLKAQFVFHFAGFRDVYFKFSRLSLDIIALPARFPHFSLSDTWKYRALFASYLDTFYFLSGPAIALGVNSLPVKTMYELLSCGLKVAELSCRCFDLMDRRTCNDAKYFNSALNCVRKLSQTSTIFHLELKCFPNLLRIAMARQKAVELITIWKDKNVTSALKIRVMKAMVWAVFQYDVEGWTLKKSDRNRIESFKMWCWAGERCSEFLGKNTVPIYQYQKRLVWKGS